jgi:hypothetical protein
MECGTHPESHVLLEARDADEPGVDLLGKGRSARVKHPYPTPDSADEEFAMQEIRRALGVSVVATVKDVEAYLAEGGPQ